MIKLFIVTYCLKTVSLSGIEAERGVDKSLGGIHPRYPEDSEPPRQGLQIPPNWSSRSYDAEFLGLLFAGKSEFNWVVEVRLADHDQEKWSIGNLVTVIHVMTTCRAITILSKGFKTNNGDAIPLELLDTDMRIYYCTQFLWEDSNEGNESSTIRGSGTRSIRTLTPHPKCTLKSFMYDYGVIELSKGINPIVPVIGYMPVHKKLSSGLIVNPHLNLMEQKKWVCYIGSYGKTYRNINNSIVQDYKVKYRVYYTEWRECEKYLRYICPANIGGCDFKTTKTRTLQKLMCFNHRKKVGALCDHDRGAPLVCDGYVYGIVVRGAEFKFCHDLTPFPVIILKTYVFIKDFSNLIRFQHLKLLDDDDEVQQLSTSKPIYIGRSHSTCLIIMQLLLHFLDSV